MDIDSTPGGAPPCADCGLSVFGPYSHDWDCPRHPRHQVGRAERAGENPWRESG